MKNIENNLVALKSIIETIVEPKQQTNFYNLARVIYEDQYKKYYELDLAFELTINKLMYEINSRKTK
jgi:hypothetical protein